MRAKHLGTIDGWPVVAGALIVAVALALWAPSAAAQQPPPPAQPRPALGAPGNPRPTAAEIQVWFDAMVLVQAQRALGLDDAQYPQFVGRLKALQDTRRRSQRQRMQIVQDIQRTLTNWGGPADEASMREKMKALDDLREKGAGEIRRAYAALDEILSVRQQARFRIFEEQIERRKFEILLNARRGRGTAR